MRLPFKLPAVYAAGLGLAAAAAALGACGSSHTASKATPWTSGCSAASTPASQVTVGETEYHLALSSTCFKAGAMTFVASNQGRIEHSLAIKGPGVNVTSSLLNPGQAADLHVTLQDGTYELWCPVPGHKALGMDTHITVTG